MGGAAVWGEPEKPGAEVEAMLRLAAKLVSFFWRREDIPEEEVRQPGRELSEGKGAWSTPQEALGRPVRWGKVQARPSFGGSRTGFGSLGLALASFANPNGFVSLGYFLGGKGA